jgi:prepilin-type N-terminal cleavage/methylation domain-containing protein
MYSKTMKFINRKISLAFFSSPLLIQKGFTLIELLVVIAVLGVLAAVLVAAINPMAKINSAKDAAVRSAIGQLANAISAYYTGQSGATYPLTLAAMVPSELKTTPKQQVGVTNCTDGSGAHGAGTDYCYNGAVATAIVWALLPSNTAQSVCWDSTSGIMKTTTIPAAAATVCP